MIERRQRLRFPLEPRQAVGIVRKRLRDNLYRDGTTELRIARAIHLAHATGAQPPGDLIWTDARAWRQRHLWGPRIIQGRRASEWPAFRPGG